MNKCVWEDLVAEKLNIESRLQEAVQGYWRIDTIRRRFLFGTLRAVVPTTGSGAYVQRGLFPDCDQRACHEDYPARRGFDFRTLRGRLARPRRDVSWQSTMMRPNELPPRQVDNHC